MTDRVPLTYCSFVKETCVGVVILDGALEPAAACKQAWRLGLNPGGEVMVVILPPDIEQRDFDRCFENRNRLLSPSDARELLDARPIREWEAEGV
jgi:hypothetical protein